MKGYKRERHHHVFAGVLREVEAGCLPILTA